MKLIQLRDALGRFTNVTKPVHERDRQGRFISTSKPRNSKTAKGSKRVTVAATHQPRDKKGRFAPIKSSKRTIARQPRDNKGRFAGDSGTESSFISTMTLNKGNCSVTVAMKRDPSIEYTYSVSQRDFNALRAGIQRGNSLGKLYNKHVKPHAIS